MYSTLKMTISYLSCEVDLVPSTCGWTVNSCTQSKYLYGNYAAPGTELKNSSRQRRCRSSLRAPRCRAKNTGWGDCLFTVHSPPSRRSLPTLKWVSPCSDFCFCRLYSAATTWCVPVPSGAVGCCSQSVDLFSYTVVVIHCTFCVTLRGLPTP